jgi:hypothetical protein
MSTTSVLPNTATKVQMVAKFQSIGGLVYNAPMKIRGAGSGSGRPTYLVPGEAVTPKVMSPTS